MDTDKENELNESGEDAADTTDKLLNGTFDLPVPSTPAARSASVFSSVCPNSSPAGRPLRPFSRRRTAARTCSRRRATWRRRPRPGPKSLPSSPRPPARRTCSEQPSYFFVVRLFRPSCRQVWPVLGLVWVSSSQPRLTSPAGCAGWRLPPCCHPPTYSPHMIV